MFPFGKARSKAELQQLKNDYMANLQVEIENANVLEARKRKPDEAPPVPPQYKTEAELRADIQAIDNELIQTIMNDIGYGYSKAVEVIQRFSPDDKTKLLALYPQFKATLAKDATKSRLMLLDPSFIYLKMQQFLNFTNKSLGSTASVGVPQTIEELENLMPTDENIIKLSTFIRNPTISSRINKKDLSLILSWLEAYVKAYPTFQQVQEFKTSKLNNNSRTALSQRLGELIINFGMIDRNDIDDLMREIPQMIKDGEDENIGQYVLDKLGGNADLQKLKYFEELWKTALTSSGGEFLPPSKDMIEFDINALTPSTDEQVGKISMRLQEVAERGSVQERGGEIYQRLRRRVDRETGMLIDRNARNIYDLADIAGDEQTSQFADDLNSVQSEMPDIAMPIQKLTQEALARHQFRDVNEVNDRSEASGIVSEIISGVEKILEDKGTSINAVEDTEYENVLDVPFQQQGNIQMTIQEPEGESIGDIIEETASNVLEYSNKEKYIRQGIDRMRRTIKKVKVIDFRSFVDEVNASFSNIGVNFSLPLQSKYTKKEISQITEMLADGIRRVADTIEYDPEEEPIFAGREVEGKDLVGFGMKKGTGKSIGRGMKKQGQKSREDERLAMEVKGLKNRISVKKLIGRGIEVQQQPTYKQFGKYVMHYPHLMNNVFNVKYPSLGSIPAIKPKTISDEYKEFVIDVFETGKVNERLFNNLDEEERTHFHRVCKGAGLLEMFKLKKGETDEEREDLERFNLLKGSYVAGNNSESVIRELRGLITKFIHEGRITKNEGLSMLMEIK